jgi:hypothetical protein
VRKTDELTLKVQRRTSNRTSTTTPPADPNGQGRHRRVRWRHAIRASPLQRAAYTVATALAVLSVGSAALAMSDIDVPVVDGLIAGAVAASPFASEREDRADPGTTRIQVQPAEPAAEARRIEVEDEPTEGTDEPSEEPEASDEPTEAEVPPDPRVNRDAGAVGGLDATQMANAMTIVEVGIERGLPERAWAVALATAMQESKCYNYANVRVPESYDYDWDKEGRDHDSVGVFQQRPSMGWGTVAELMDVATAAHKFYAKLEKVDGWEDLAITRAAQLVQISAHPTLYAQWEPLAWDVIEAVVER